MIDVLDIMKKLPHRYPFLLVDRIIAMEPNVSITGIKNVTINEPFFQGHFPGQPIMPGVLIIEAMAQVGGVLAFSTNTDANAVFFMSIEKAKFRKPVVPGDQLKMELQVIHQRGNVWKLSGVAKVDDKVVAEADLTAMLTHQES